MANRQNIIILHDYLVEEKYETTGCENRKESAEVVEKLEKILGEDEKKLFEKLLNLWMHIECDSNEDHFVLGFRTGFKMALEVTEHGNEEFMCRFKFNPL